jgi:hypothetical protein
MRFHYVSPSLLPSRTANSTHVMLQCAGLLQAGADVTLYARRMQPDATSLPAALAQAYGIDSQRLQLVTFFGRWRRADLVRIAAMAVPRLWRAPRNEVVLSRNLYAAYALAVLRRRPMIFETHHLELGPRKDLQRAIMRRPWVTTVVVSQKLAQCLLEHHGEEPHRTLVLHDAAAEGIRPLPPAQRRAALSVLMAEDLGPWRAACGYFGHLYPGRGIELIEALAGARPQCLFLLYGGNDAEVAARRVACASPNVRYMGHVPHPVAMRAMTAVDVLLMPYQQSVSIGIAGHDTARWMSPMKMFEYLAAGVPVISSDLPVLREVLRDGENCLLAPPADIAAWVGALDRLLSEPQLAQGVGARAHQDYRRSHTWKRRAETLIDAAQALT